MSRIYIALALAISEFPKILSDSMDALALALASTRTQDPNNEKHLMGVDYVDFSLQHAIDTLFNRVSLDRITCIASNCFSRDEISALPRWLLPFDHAAVICRSNVEFLSS